MKIDLRQMYRVVESDRGRRADRVVATRATKRGAQALMARLNAAAVREHGLRGPLYYVERRSERETPTLRRQ